jgi:hypothetical protein
VFLEKEFGVEYDAEVPDMWTARDGSILKGSVYIPAYLLPCFCTVPYKINFMKPHCKSLICKITKLKTNCQHLIV